MGGLSQHWNKRAVLPDHDRFAMDDTSFSAKSFTRYYFMAGDRNDPSFRNRYFGNSPSKMVVDPANFLSGRNSEVGDPWRDIRTALIHSSFLGIDDIVRFWDPIYLESFFSPIQNANSIRDLGSFDLHPLVTFILFPTGSIE